MSHYSRNSACIIGFHFQPSCFFSKCPNPVLPPHLPLPNYTENFLPSICSPLLKPPIFYTHTHTHIYIYIYSLVQSYSSANICCQCWLTKMNNTLVIPLSDWTIIYCASILANPAFSSICALKSSCPLTPAPTPLFVCLVHVHSLFH
jgi:hypothetical protein